MFPGSWPEKREILDFAVVKKENLTEGLEFANMRTRCRIGAACVPYGKAKTATCLEIVMVFFFWLGFLWDV